MLNGQPYSCTNVNVGFPQRCILGLLLLLIYINDLSEGLSSSAKLFSDDASLFSVAHDINTSAIELNSDLLPRQAFITIYKAFVRLRLDYVNVLYDQAFNHSFHAKVEPIQYNVCLAITGAI